jgi:hypothetical protein
MKKTLLLSTIIGFAFVAPAQNQMLSRKNPKRVEDSKNVVVEKIQKTQILGLKNIVATDVLNQTYVGKAGHQGFLQREETHIVSYTFGMDVISAVGILDPETYPNVDELGNVGMWYSANKGETWNGPVILNDSTTQGFNYYISGSLFNPEGNTNIENMYGVYQGTFFPYSGSWNYLAFGSSTLDGSHLTNYLFEEEEGYFGYWNIFGLNQYGNEMRALKLKLSGPWANFTKMEFEFITGGFNGEGFDWDFQNPIDANLYVDTNGVIAWIGMYDGMDIGTEIAWSDDGMTGYVWAVGVSNENATGYQPVIFRTEDGGENWEYVDLDFFTPEMQNILEPYLYESSAGYLIPHVFESAGVVDFYGNLQMMVAMGSTSADVITYPDSIGYRWVYPGDLFNIVVNENGILDFFWVDSLKTENVLSDTPGNYCGTAGWNHRISAAISEDEKYIFFTWLDTRDIGETYNLSPDLFGWGKNVYSEMTQPICLSEESELEGFFYFNYGADKAYFGSDLTWHIPYLHGVTPVEFVINNSATHDPVTLSCVSGVNIFLWEGIEGFAPVNRIIVSQNTPNPFTNITSIDVSTKTAAAVTVEVGNIMGQTMYTVDAGIINGTQKIELSAENLEAGVYFYTVHVGNERITNKMIVE